MLDYNNSVFLLTSLDLDIRHLLESLHENLITLQENDQKKSKNCDQARIKVPRIYANTKHQSDDFFHKLYNKLIRKNKSLEIENLKVLKNHKLVKAISEASRSILKTFLEYNCKWNNRTLIIALSNDPSSQLCLYCIYQNKKVKLLKVREWIWQQCNHHHDRYLNAKCSYKFFTIN